MINFEYKNNTMKKQLLVFLLFFCLFQTNCSKSNNSSVSNGNSNQNLATSPSAKAPYDNSNYGIYKGVFIGSSGVIILDISNGNDSLTATLIIDGVAHHFISDQPIQQNENTTITFEDGNDNFTFIVSSNGSNPTITNLNINGHPNAAILVVKETSTTLVKCYEGTFSGDFSGVLNALIYGSVIKGMSRAYGETSIVTWGGMQSNNQLNNVRASNGGTCSGTINGNNINGNWVRDSDHKSGTCTAVRTY